MNSSVRTDLAIENAEMFQETEELQGIRIEEERGQVSGIRVTWVTVENEQGAKMCIRDRSITSLSFWGKSPSSRPFASLTI